MAWLKRALALVALGVLVYLFWPLLGEISAAAHLFRSARWPMLPLVLGIQFVSYCFLTWLNRLTLQPFPGKIPFFRLMALLTSMAFIEVALPSAGASGVALRARLLGKQGGYSVEAATFTLALETIVLSIAMASAGLLGLFYLLRTGEVGWTRLVVLALLALVVASLVYMGWHGLQDPEFSLRAADRLGSLWNRLFGRWRRVEVAGLEARLEAFRHSLGQYRRVPLWKFLVAAYARVALDVATLGACFLLFGYAVAPGTLLTGYGLILVMSGLAALPGGLGMADASVPVIFSRLGAPGSVALVAGLTYRLIAFWLLRFIGFLSWLALEKKRASP
jgi:uncharacterized protein (TIRG00374 family)